MQFGIVRRTQHPKIADVARAVEDAGFESLWLTEHTHVPVGSMSEAEAERRRQLLDPFVALAAAAAVTSELRLGTAVCVLSHREPLVLAKTVATLDLISNGRILFGVGAGSVPEENLNFGITSRQYGTMLR
ncbi:MAG: LLM class flavin-dependent oxidoreductase, partial [Candidatus Limnocylindria bacterium]